MTMRVQTGLGRGLLAAAAAALLVTGFSGTANAGLKIFGVYDLDNVFLTSSNGPLDPNSITISSQTQALLGGIDPINNDGFPPNPAPNPAQSCIDPSGVNGPNCPGEDVFTMQPDGITYSRADAAAAGNVFVGPGANLDQVGELQLAATTFLNSGNTNFDLDATIDINGSVTLTFDALLDTMGFLHPDVLPNSGGSISFVAALTITDLSGTELVNWQPGVSSVGIVAETSPCSLNIEQGLQQGSEEAFSFTCDNGAGGQTGFSATTILLNGTFRLALDLGINYSGTAAKAQVPEPSALLLMGVGLLGLGAFARRRKAAA
ncbi:MAG: EDSAP-1 family PEP-CTERM protein [Pseudomonadota bacterium]